MKITKWPAERFEQLKELAAQELTSHQIGRILGITRDAVLGKAWRCGIQLLGWQRQQREVKATDPGLTEQKVRKVRKRKPRLHHPSPPKIPLDPVDVGNPCNLFQLRRAHCRWPMWDLRTPFEAKHFCGQHTIKGSSYCAEHAAMVYQPIQRRGGAPFRLPKVDVGT